MTKELEIAVIAVSTLGILGAALMAIPFLPSWVSMVGFSVICVSAATLTVLAILHGKGILK